MASRIDGVVLDTKAYAPRTGYLPAHLGQEAGRQLAPWTHLRGTSDSLTALDRVYSRGLH